MDIESYCTKTKLMVETFAKEIPTVALGETEFGYLDEIKQFSVFDYFD